MANQEKTKRLDARRNKDKILSTVAQMIREDDDVEAMKMTTIAKRAEVGVGTLYRHFANKSILCQGVIDNQIDAMLKEIRTFLSEHENAPLYDRVHGILEIFLTLKDNNLNLLNFIEKNGLKTNAMSGAPFYNDLYQYIQREMEKEPELVDIELKIDMLLNAFSSDMYMFERFTRGYSKEAYLKKLLNIYLK
ncbi:TetR/AcrR family transcriptional regulator [Staphylococcus intermedius]|uniref:TetR family regulatory protein n=1 Tax=Staphylococcus intermedius NCTC 11048 TaxID=1141106 RepID=A0A380G6L8_STAIN|nr:TetR/AcrR family transcriptional regulator [Staphylococcus intermedius]PCF64070.1 TetR family transcriptional regulator [Staphylococcus intermedius]PCF78785.1 TetR family transcriptional regulator [Staphylococcus intermedius]PCF79758.1 TetR family transcriptional regulator [Staphylococcus intermedius]PCF85892.1 TetR family transcriptional regulator [Staphylococcus intermedius]PCF89583.1 TetR family transcriptional regulator [Staphylococcus intermedius]